MGAIATSRAELVAALAPVGVTVTDHVPEQLNPPALMVVHGSPLIEVGDTFGLHLLRLEVWIVSKLGANARMTDDLDALIEATIAATVVDGWSVENVAQPFSYTVGARTFLASTVTLTTDISLT
ncbi:hypothetical protein GCM10009840_17870 [Pseudolysinimonas kribbensis]|uniref:DUF3168 domain-containing protein n=1 Tax=Pseudolysinimonas kribbensis TaxID=433641 RepID=A0ABQ6K4Z3_9MICO|nr:hypothetical protein [Pseudolysinimonas kribbensis]GMA93831.1 hypothetical protein GCM10025881_06550 [Pseudolysinimonas kribbensis]